MGERKKVYMTLTNPEQVYVPVEKGEDEFDYLYYQFKNGNGELYELRFWQKNLFEVTLPSGEVIHATLEVEKFEGNPFPKYENGALWDWMKTVLKIHATGIVPVIKRYRYVKHLQKQ